MTSEQFWAELRAWGYTKWEILKCPDIRRVILQSPSKGEFPGISHPDDLSPEERVAELKAFKRRQMI